MKDRILEHLAVRKLRTERGLATRGGRGAGAILALVGPPGVGKTSLGESVARALGRSFVRVALGGVRDEAEIRGHRRTYVGAQPGRLVRAIREAGTMNPVIVLDEVDKLGADYRGDPSSALLEVLDPAQNHTFRDHYLEVELDLSKVLFIATANMADTIPGPLLDRMEVIRLDGYTEDEKVAIARHHLLARQLERAALGDDELEVADEALHTIVADYTREAGVRSLERELGRLARKVASKVAAGEAETPLRIGASEVALWLGRPRFFFETADRTAVPGVATGLAVTGTGGDVLYVEASVMDGPEGLTLTGQLGDVMKESAEIALSLRALPRRRTRHRSGRVRGEAVPRARAGRRHPEGRSVRRGHHGDRAGKPFAGRARLVARGHDRRGDPARPGPPHRRCPPEGAGRSPGRTTARRAAGPQRSRPGGRPRGRSPRGRVPLGGRGGRRPVGRLGRRVGYRCRCNGGAGPVCGLSGRAPAQAVGAVGSVGAVGAVGAMNESMIRASITG